MSARVAGDVTRLTVLVILTLVVSVFAFLLLVVVLIVLFWHRRKQNKQSPIYLEVSNLSPSLSAQSQISGEGGGGGFSLLKKLRKGLIIPPFFLIPKPLAVLKKAVLFI
jgi:hypothetical protein